MVNSKITETISPLIPRLTMRFAGQTLALVGGGVVWEECVLLVIAVDRTGSYDVILVLAH